jgi:hypothetical protein
MWHEMKKHFTTGDAGGGLEIAHVKVSPMTRGVITHVPLLRINEASTTMAMHASDEVTTTARKQEANDQLCNQNLFSFTTVCP